MKDINDILAGYGLTDEQVSTICSEVVENYRSLGEVKQKDERITELRQQIEELNAKVAEAAESGQKVDELQSVIDDYKAKEEARLKDEEEKARRDSFATVFDTALDGKEFANELMRETVFEKVYAMCQSDAGVGAKEALESVTKDVSGVWVNPQNDVRKMPGAGTVGNMTPDKNASKRAFASLLFGSGEE